jgi:hypothetical protein
MYQYFLVVEFSHIYIYIYISIKNALFKAEKVGVFERTLQRKPEIFTFIKLMIYVSNTPHNYGICAKYLYPYNNRDSRSQQEIQIRILPK